MWVTWPTQPELWGLQRCIPCRWVTGLLAGSPPASSHVSIKHFGGVSHCSGAVALSTGEAESLHKGTFKILQVTAASP